MSSILDVIAFVKAHLTDITTAIAYIIAAATIVVKLTPTPKDDDVLGKIAKFVGKYIALNK